MQRRGFLTLAGGALAWPFAAHAQETSAKLRIGVLSLFSLRTAAAITELERQMRALGYHDGQNLTWEFMHLNGQSDRYHYTLQELIRRKVDLIITYGPEIGLKWSLKETTSIPIVMYANDYDPLTRGYVANLQRPAGNVTGLYFRQTELAVRRLQLFRQALPSIRAATVFVDESSIEQWEAMKAAQAANGIDLWPAVFYDDPYDYEEAFAQAPPAHRHALIVPMSPFFLSNRKEIAEFTLRNRLPAMSAAWEFADAGLLFSYGPDLAGLTRRVCTYVDRIARGAKPQDLPIEKLSNFEIVVNLRTAEWLGVIIPQSFQQRDNDTIERTTTAGMS